MNRFILHLLSLFAVSSLSGNDTFRVILPENPTVTEKFAASEVEHFVHRMTGWQVSADKGFCIEIGQSIRNPASREVIGGRDSFVIQSEAEGVKLYGENDRGTLYAVYQWLKQQGCRWYFPGELGEIVPQRKDLDREVGRFESTPVFQVREIDKIQSKDVSDEQAMNWAARNRLNRQFSLHRNFKEVAKRGRFVSWHRLAHNYEWVLPVDKYFTTNPDYYALYHGRRVPLGMEQANICTTHPEVIEIFAREIGNWFDTHPEGTVFPLSPPDGLVRWCECEKCIALGGENFTPGEAGSMTRRQLQFVNAVARLVKKTHPEAVILLLPYQNYHTPVDDIELEPNIVVQVARTGDLLRPVTNATPFGKTFRRWNADGIWDYALLADGDPKMPFPIARSLAETIQWMGPENSRYYFIQATASIRHNPLPYWLIAELTWDPTLNIDDLIDQFCTDLYGNAGDTMQQYWNLLESSARESSWKPEFWRDLTSPPSTWISDDLITKASALLDAADKSASTDKQKARISLARESFETAKNHCRPIIKPTNQPIEPNVNDEGAIDINSTDRPLTYPGKFLRTASGELSLSFRIDKKPDENEVVNLVSAGRKGNEGWFQIYISNQTLGWIWQGSEHNVLHQAPFYSHLHFPFQAAPGDTHEVKVAWNAKGRGRGTVSISVDGTVRESRNNTDINSNFFPDSFGIGCSTAGLSAGRFDGAIGPVKFVEKGVSRFSTQWKTGKPDLPAEIRPY